MKKYILLIMLLACIFTACGGRETEKIADTDISATGNEKIAEYEDGVLIAITETQESAEEIAERCGISLIKWEYSVAIFHTEKNLDEVIEFAAGLNLPVLEKNYLFNN